MKPRSSSAFTLIEVMTAVTVAVIFAALVIQLSSHPFKKHGIGRVQAEIAMLSTACESYKADFGAYPEDSSAEQSTNKLKPRKNFKATNREYQLASRFLYKELTGDKLGAGGAPDGIPEKNEPRYLKEFDPKLLKTTKDTNNRILEVQYIEDPFGYPYGYSTAAAHGDADTPHPSDLDGFNSSSFDLWSTGGSNPVSDPTDDKKKELEWAKWIKNW
jgi:Tfp pilus assembly protein PilE